MPELTEKELAEPLKVARSTGVFANTSGKAKDISYLSFCHIREELKAVKLKKIALYMKSITDEKLKVVQEIFQSHNELEHIDIFCNQATAAQIKKIAESFPLNSKMIELEFAELNETALLDILLNIKNLKEITSLSLVNCVNSFNFSSKVKDEFKKMVHSCESLKEISIKTQTQIPEFDNALKNYITPLQKFLNLRNNFNEFANSTLQTDFDASIKHLRAQFSLLMQLSDARLDFYHEFNEYFKKYLTYLSTANYSYEQIPKFLNCFIHLFSKLTVLNCLQLYPRLAHCALVAEINQTKTAEEQEENLYEKKIIACAFLFQYELSATEERNRYSSVKIESWEEALVNILNDLNKKGMVPEKTLVAFFQQNAKECCDILADVAECMNTYKLPTNESLYEIIDKANGQSLMMGLASEEGRRQLIKIKQDKINQNLRITNRALEKRVRNLEEQVEQFKKLKSQPFQFFPQAQKTDSISQEDLETLPDFQTIKNG